MKPVNFSTCILIALSLISCGGDSPPKTSTSNGTSQTANPVNLQEAESNMVGAWSTSPYGPYPLGPLTREGTPLPGAPEVVNFPGDQAVNRSFRMLINPTLGGRAIRLRFSNLKGTKPITLENISIAHGNPLLPNIDSATQTKLTSGGQPKAIIQPGEELITDVVAFEYKAQDNLAVTFHIAGESGPMTWHGVSFGTQFISSHNSGDVTKDAIGLSFREVSVGWFFLSGLDTFNPKAKHSIVALGDSITDGFLQVLNGRWTDRLAQRLNSQNLSVGILNQGINGNTVTPVADGGSGPAAVLRFDRDVLQRSGVKGLILFEGTNDLGRGVKADELILAYQSLIAKARERGLCVFMGTIPPRADIAFGWLPDGPITKEPERLKVNEWIRTTSLIDGVIDFDKVLGLPASPVGIPNPLLYIPDLLHPNNIGFVAMGNAVDIQKLVSKCELS